MDAEDLGRPRLAEHVLARRHVIGEREFVVLHDESTGDHLELSPVAWALLDAADGTRDIQGITAAAQRSGAVVGQREAVKLLKHLHERGALEQGPPEHSADVVTPRPRSPEVARQPVAPLPDYLFDCDGTGGCCRSYGSVLLTPDDQARARATLPQYSIGPVAAHRWFTPAHGSAPSPLVVPTSCEGGCGFLDDDGLCAIHRKGGISAKPVACAAFPTLACSDGKQVRMTVSPECACVLRSAGGARGERLGEGLERGADLPITTVIDELPPRVVADEGVEIERGELRELVAEAIGSLPVVDPARACWGWADTWCERVPSPVQLDDVDDALDALQRRARSLLRRMSSWRPDDDWVLKSLRWLVGTLHLLENAELRASVIEPSDETSTTENLYVRASLWGYVGFFDTPVAVVLREHALKIWLARAMEVVPLAPSEHALALSSVSMLLRGHGLAAAWHDVLLTQSESSGSSGGS